MNSVTNPSGSIEQQPLEQSSVEQQSLEQQPLGPFPDRFLFEVSWEVCNKVGGIYTVLESKAAHIAKQYANYILIGPYIPAQARIEWYELPIPELWSDACSQLVRQGIILHYGRWERVESKPLVILVEYNSLFAQKNEIKKWYWDNYQIDSLRGYYEFEEPLLWGHAAGMVIAQFEQSIHSSKTNSTTNTTTNTTTNIAVGTVPSTTTPVAPQTVIAQFHEWIAGSGLLYLKKYAPHIACVFTTHATVLGRCLAGNNRDLYHEFEHIDVLTEVYRYSIEAKHLLEKAAANTADVFTTVSHITAHEAERFLGRTPEILLLNGIDGMRFPDHETMMTTYHESNTRIKEFLTYTFFPSYVFNLNRCSIFYTIGRFEHHTKGYDIIIKSLAQLREQLVKEKSDSTVAMFFWVPMQHRGVREDLVKQKNAYAHMKELIVSHESEIVQQVLTAFMSSQESSPLSTILSPLLYSHLHRDAQGDLSSQNPPLSTHLLVQEENNILLQDLKQYGFMNAKDDPIKIIVEPIYLDGHDGLLDLAYYDSMIGCDLGIFPSYYEPWGYTPLESCALGVPAITTDLAGFGLFIKNHPAIHAAKRDIFMGGISIIERANISEEECVSRLTTLLYDFLKQDQRAHADSRVHAKNTSTYADWNTLIRGYLIAHTLALHKVNKTIEHLNP
ncbi:MAG: glycosyltransferase [Candidatus Woesearchaeota archaeon]